MPTSGQYSIKVSVMSGMLTKLVNSLHSHTAVCIDLAKCKRSLAQLLHDHKARVLCCYVNNNYYVAHLNTVHAIYTALCYTMLRRARKFKRHCALHMYVNLIMASMEPHRTKAYGEDLKWRMVYQRLMLGLTYKQIATNLSVDISTVWRAVEKFQTEGTVGSKYCKGPQTLSEFQKFVIMQTVLEKPAAYLREICTDLSVNTGTTVSESAICRFFQRNNFSRKKLHLVAKQRNEQLRLSFVSDCEIYTPEMLVFVDETGSDNRDSMRKFGYALRGQRATSRRILCRGKRVNSVAAMDINGVVCVDSTTDSMNADAFCDFLECSLLPQLLPFNGTNPRSVVLLDNASIHRVSHVISLIQSIGALVHFLPPYSPDLNLIEELFSKVKSVLKESDQAIQWIGEECASDIVQAAFSSVTAEDCIGWFEHAGYIY